MDLGYCVAGLNDEADIVVVGSCIIECVTYVRTLLSKYDLSMAGHNVHHRYGGKGANQCVAAAKLGASVALISKLGLDRMGKSYIEELQKYHCINTKYIWFLKDIPTGVATIAISNSNAHTTILVPGANTYLSPSDVDAARNMLLKAKVVLLQGETPWETTLYCLSKLLVSPESRAKVVLNPSPAVYPMNPMVLILADIVCLNELEAGVIAGMSIDNEEDLAECMIRLLDMKCDTVIITLGDNGVVYASIESPRLKTIPIDRVEPVESHGAGDCFVGALAFFLCYYPDLPLGELIVRSCHIARESLLVAGLQNSFPEVQNLDRRLFYPTCEFYKDI